MTSSLREALRQSGALDQFKPSVAREKPKENDNRASKPPKAGAKPAAHPHSKPRQSQKPARQHDQEMDLAKAYALRAQTEQRERALKEQAEREAAERRRAQRAQIAALLNGKTLNRDEAETPRHFEYGGKIRRVYVTDEQLEQVNDGRLGVIQMRGRYMLVESALAETIRAIDANAVALLVDPNDVDAVSEEP